MAGRLLLIGAGHAHLFTLEAIARHRVRAREVVLVSPKRLQLHSPMVPGLLEGRYTLNEVSVDLSRAAARLGARLIENEVVQIDSGARTVALGDGTRLEYDVASVAIGGRPAGGETPGARRHACFVKPAHLVPDLLTRIEAAASAAGPEPLQVVVVGAGVRGVEIALTVRTRLDRLGASRAIFSLVDSTPTVLRDRSVAAQAAAERALLEAEITLRLGIGVEEVGDDYVRVTGGRVIPADLVIWATASEAPALFRDSGLPLDHRGFLAVEDTLAVLECPYLFGAGEAVSLISSPRTPRSAGEAARQGPILVRNLRSALDGQTPTARFRPSDRHMAVMNRGDGRAILSFREFAATSRVSMGVKDRMDRRFVRRFRNLV